METLQFSRSNGRSSHTMRAVSFQRNYLEFAEGSCLVSFGRTKVICTASIEDRVPSFLNGSGQGWITAEYAMLPKATIQRTTRDQAKSGRSHEIKRLIGRSLRSVVDLTLIGERTIYLDCDVIQADGGTRTASISGASVALYDALSFMEKNNLLKAWPMSGLVAAVSVGIIEGQVCLDLDYSEDSNAEVDFNVVKTESGKYVEVQGTAERGIFDDEQLNELLHVADIGIKRIIEIQRETLELSDHSM